MIVFNNNRYQTRELNLPVFGNVLISTIELNDNLFDLRDRYISNEASIIDEQIFYYVEEKEMHSDLVELQRLILSQILV